MKTKTRIINFSIIILFLLISCKTSKTRKANKEISMRLVEWYGKLLSESLSFLEKNKNIGFKDSLQKYLDTSKVNLYKNPRLETYVCQPILLNKSQDKAIVLVLNRIFNSANKRSENISYISAKYENGRWFFKLKEGHTDGFDYFKNTTTISDTEIGMDIIDRLVQYGYMKNGELYSESLFNSDMYVIK